MAPKSIQCDLDGKLLTVAAALKLPRADKRRCKCPLCGNRLIPHSRDDKPHHFEHRPWNAKCPNCMKTGAYAGR